MDKVIYFYVNGMREETTPPFKMYTYRRRGYVLLRVGLAAWFVKRWKQCGKEWETVHDAVEKSVTGKQEICDIGEKSLWKAIVCRLIRPVHLRQEKRQAKQALCEECIWWQKQIEELRTQIRGSVKEEQDEIWFSCEEELLSLLMPGKCGEHAAFLGKNENRILPYPFFENYFAAEWVEHMLSYAVLPHNLVLGYHRDLKGFLCRRADRMKSLQWIFPARLYDEEMEAFLEEFYEEYGIAVAVRLLEEGEHYWQTDLSCRVPCNILDFSQEEKIPAWELAKGSIWIDLSSSEEKCRRMEERNRGVAYFSLKKEWKRPVLP